MLCILLVVNVLNVQIQLLFISNTKANSSVYLKKKGIFRSLFLGKLDVFVVCSADTELSGVPADEHEDTLEMFSLHQKSQ